MSISVGIEDVLKTINSMLEAKSTIAPDVAEYEFQGTSFAYPCVRFSVECEPDECGGYLVRLNVYCWSEQKSSNQVIRISEEIVSKMHDKIYVGAVRLQNMHLITTPPAVRDDRLWRKEMYFRCRATK